MLHEGPGKFHPQKVLLVRGHINIALLYVMPIDLENTANKATALSGVCQPLIYD